MMYTHTKAKTFISKRLLSVLLAVVVVLSFTMLMPEEAEAIGEIPGTSAYYDARWNDAKVATNTINSGTSYTNYLGVTATTQLEGPWNLSPGWGTTCSNPWNGAAAGTAPSVTTTVTSNGGTSLSGYLVSTAEQLRWCIVNKKSFRLTNDIDLGGYMGRNWTLPTQSTTTYIADGNGHTIYNFSMRTLVSYSSLFGRSYNLTIQDLRISNSYILMNGNGTSTDGFRSALFIAYATNVTMDGCVAEDSLAALINSGNIITGMSAMLYDSTIKNCYTDNVHAYCRSGYNEGNFATLSCSSQLACSGRNVTITDSFAMNGSVIGNKGHNGGFASCLYGATIKRCFNSNVNVYGNTDAGSFSGVMHEGIFDIEDCFTSGKIEGTQTLGGFIGAFSVSKANDAATLSATIKNCYSTALVGVQNNAMTKVGGFYGSYEDTYYGLTTNARLTLATNDCYAAGEVGTIQTNSYSNRAAIDKTIAGFTGDHMVTAPTYHNCFYDMQTTAMRQWAIGTRTTGYNGYQSDTLQGNTFLYGNMDVKGVLTSDSVKCGTGLTSSPNSNGNGTSESGTMNSSFTGFSNNSKWTYTDGYYPQLAAFTNPTTFTNTNWMSQTDMTNLVKACALASTSTVKLDEWDYDYEGNALPKHTYDTVRDVTAGAPLTNTASTSWKRCGVTGNGTLDTGSGAQTTVFGNLRDVITLEDDAANGWLIKDPFPGVDWLRTTQTVAGQEAYRSLRVCPTDGMYAGESNTIVNINSSYDHADDMKMVYTTGARWTVSTSDMTYGIYPDTDLTTPQTATINSGGLQNPMALETLYADIWQNDQYTDIDVGNMQRTSTTITSFPAATAATGNTLNTVIRKATGIDGVGHITYSPVVLNGIRGDKFNGNINFAPADVGRYLISYYWSINDGRYLTATKGVTVRAVPAHVTISVEDESGASVSDACGLDAYNGGTPPATIAGMTDMDTVATPLYQPTGVSWTDSAKYEIISLKVTIYDGYMIPHDVTIANPTVGDTITLPIRYYVDDVDADGNAVTYSTVVNQTYTVTKAGNIYSLVFNKTGTQSEPQSLNGIDYNLADMQADAVVVLVVKKKTAEIKVKKLISNYTAEMANQKFIINLGGDAEAEVALKHNETSKAITHIIDGASDIVNVSEIVPFEYNTNYTVSAAVTHGDGTTTAQTGKNITVLPGDTVMITVTNTYSADPYFKAREWVDNKFTP